MAEISGAIGAVSINLNDLDQHKQMLCAKFVHRKENSADSQWYRRGLLSSNLNT